jgi:hypothetical protein
MSQKLGLIRQNMWVLLLGLIIALLEPWPDCLLRDISQRSVKTEPPAMRLILQSSKSLYRLGEPLKLTSYLENLTGATDHPKWFYVGRSLGGFSLIMPRHFIELSVRDSKGKEVPFGKVAADEGGENETVAELLARAYIILGPGQIYGISDELDLRLQPGQYQLKTTYREFGAQHWPATELQALRLPVWTQQLTSNTLTIVVLKQRLK